MPIRRSLRVALYIGLCLALMMDGTSTSQAFVVSPSSFCGVHGKSSINPAVSQGVENSVFQRGSSNGRSSSTATTTELNSFMGSDGGILGIGTPELFTILLVGYFVLGPSDLYKLTKEIGKFVQNLRTFTTEASSTFENSMESSLQLQEIRKAQQDLNEAFSFRRSINVDAESEAFSVNAQTERLGETGAAVVGAGIASEAERPATVSEAVATADANGKKKKIIRRRVKKTLPEEDGVVPPPASVVGAEGTTTAPLANDIPPTLDMSAEIARQEQEEDAKAMADLERMRSELKAERDSLEAKRQASEEASDDAAKLREERMSRLRGETPASAEDAAVERELATSGYDLSTEDAAAATNRFQAQMSGSWNDQIVANTEELKPLAAVMDQLALLEQEKIAADARLEEEYRMRADNEEKYYREKRSLLEQAAQQMQQTTAFTGAPAAVDGSATTNSTSTTATIAK